MKRIFSAMTCALLCIALGGAGAFAYADTTASKSDGKDAAKESQAEEPQPGVVDEFGAIGPVVIDDVYASGIHYATLTVKGYEPMEVEVYGTAAPQTSSLFCNLLMRHYYDGKTINGLTNSLYAQMGDRTGKTAGKYTVEGEFKEAGYLFNTMGLKRGVIAMSRSNQKDGDKTAELKSDASSLYVFLSDASYLNDNYAGFAKITKGVSTFSEICEDISKNAKIKDDGSIAKKKQCPVIESFVLQHE